MAGQFADPDYEPTDEELRALSRAAFSGVRDKHERALEKLHQEIAAARAKQRESMGLSG